MPYVTSIERNAEQRGREAGLEAGRTQGSVTLLLRQLTLKCDPLPDSIRGQVQQLSLEKSQLLGDALLGFGSLNDLQEWLRLNVAP